ncbi:hypothetical protein Hanom_Chr12g01147521 [Helianthus anomalus]
MLGLKDITCKNLQTSSMFFVYFEDKGYTLQFGVNIKDHFCNLLYYQLLTFIYVVYRIISSVYKGQKGHFYLVSNIV